MGELNLVFQDTLLQIFQKLNNERTISSAYHLLRGKRSGQTIQDVGIFQLHQYFGLLPKLPREIYDEEIKKLIDSECIVMLDESYFTLTPTGEERFKQSMPLPYDGWFYRGNEQLFFARLSLVVQSLSHQRAGKMSFSPIQKDEQVQLWVKQFLVFNRYQNGDLQEKLLNEILLSLEGIPVIDKNKMIIAKRLSGYQTPGYTWQQLSFQEYMNEIDVQLIFIACLHAWLNEIIANQDAYPLLNNIAMNIRVEIPLTGSANQTAQLFKEGYSIEQISGMRQLKMSTIEDHLIELAMNDPRFTIETFISKEDIQRVITAVEDYSTRKLKILHEVLPHLSYFQIRLVLARGE